MTHEATRLAACPFCGSDKISEDFGDESACVRCRNCGCQSGRVFFTEAERESDDFSRSEADAREAWNRRAALAQRAPTAEVALPAVSEEAERVAFEAAYEAACAETYTLHPDFKAGWDARAQSAAKGDEARDAARWRTMRQRFVAVDWDWGGGETGMGMAVAMFEIDPTLPVFAGPECADAFADCPLPTAPLPHENPPEAQA